MDHDELINLDAPMMTLQETTVAIINDLRVGCGNVLEREYALPDGSAAKGLSMRLSLADSGEQLIIGAGSRFRIGNSQWRCALVRPKSAESHYGEAVIEQIL